LRRGLKAEPVRRGKLIATGIPLLQLICDLEQAPRQRPIVHLSRELVQQIDTLLSSSGDALNFGMNITQPI